MRIDLHVDTLWKMTKYGYFDLNKEVSYSGVSINGLKKAGLDGVVFALYVPRHLESVSEYLLNSQISFVRAQNLEGFKVYLGLEGGGLLGNDEGCVLQRLAYFAKVGIVYLTITHNHNTFWADSATDECVHEGLTEFGAGIVKMCERLKILVDISHTSPNTAHDVLDVSEKPVIASHSGCRAIFKHPRNISNHLIQKIAASGGVIGIPFVKNFVESLEGVANHIDHAVQMVGSQHVAIGSDLDGAVLVSGINNIAHWNKVFDILAHRGYNNEAIADIQGTNITKLFRQSTA